MTVRPGFILPPPPPPACAYLNFGLSVLVSSGQSDHRGQKEGEGGLSMGSTWSDEGVCVVGATPSLPRARSCPGQGESIREVLTGTLPILPL